MSSPPDAFSSEQARALAWEHFGVDLPIRTVPSYIDQNFILGDRYVLKIAHTDEARAVLDLQNQAMDWLHERGQTRCQRAIADKSGQQIVNAIDPAGQDRLVRLVTFLPGRLLADVRHEPELLRDLGHAFGELDRELLELEHPAAERDLDWDLMRASATREHTHLLDHRGRREIAERVFDRFEHDVLPRVSDLRRSIIHNDGNDYNVLVEASDPPRQVTGILDLGDILRTCTICELAIVVAYAILGKHDPLAAAERVIAGYHEALPLTEQELDVLFDLVGTRLAVSVTMSTRRQAEDPDNQYISISQRSAWVALEQLACIDGRRATQRLRRACGLESPVEPAKGDNLREARSRVLGPALSLAYRHPIEIVRGSMQYLFDAEGRSYLDCVNNVCHVGHCHPHVVAAGQRQMAALNTNTRYLHRTIVEYAERLAATMPDPLSVCTFVCSGSEANELALRMARAYTGAKDLVVVDGAYHGNTDALVDISPYKPRETPSHVHVVATPDTYRNPLGLRGDLGPGYAAEIERVVTGRRIAAFLCESVMSCVGQIVLPPQYLAHAFRHARSAGGVCIADEVQVGFGRVGSHMWGFETQEVVPDIVTLGKPMGNGHPLAAVVTTPEVAEAFADEMEYFNTFGGNPVSCAIGMAVLDVIDDEGLQSHAHEVGKRLRASLTELRERHSIVGDVRGLGLFNGIELVRDRATLEPAAEEAADIVEALRERGVLVSADGRLRNVIKIKPPLVFTRDDAAQLAEALDSVLHARSL